MDSKIWWILGGAAAMVVLMTKKGQAMPVTLAQRTTLIPLTLESLRTAMPKLPLSRAMSYWQALADAVAWADITTPARLAAFLAQVGHESVDFKYMEEIADGSAYEGRTDLGNVKAGDGKKFKGRGPIQLTGRLNYRAFGNAVGMDFEANPELVAKPEWGFKAASWFWKSRGLNAHADRGDFDRITKIINGGYNGKADRDARYAVALAALTPTTTVA